MHVTASIRPFHFKVTVLFMNHDLQRLLFRSMTNDDTGKLQLSLQYLKKRHLNTICEFNHFWPESFASLSHTQTPVQKSWMMCSAVLRLTFSAHYICCAVPAVLSLTCTSRIHKHITKSWMLFNQRSLHVPWCLSTTHAPSLSGSLSLTPSRTRLHNSWMITAKQRSLHPCTSIFVWFGS